MDSTPPTQHVADNMPISFDFASVGSSSTAQEQSVNGYDVDAFPGSSQYRLSEEDLQPFQDNYLYNVDEPLQEPNFLSDRSFLQELNLGINPQVVDSIMEVAQSLSYEHVESPIPKAEPGPPIEELYSLTDGSSQYINDSPATMASFHLPQVSPTFKHEPIVDSSPNTVAATSPAAMELDTAPAPKRHKANDLQKLRHSEMSADPDKGAIIDRLGEFSRQYKGLIKSPGHAADVRSTYESLSARPKRLTSSPETDPTFPQNNQQYQAHIKTLFEAICDWSSMKGWRAKMGSNLVNTWLTEVSKDRSTRGLDPDVSKLSDEEIMPPRERMPSVDEQWQNVIHQKMSDLEIEILCSQILVSIMYC